MLDNELKSQLTSLFASIENSIELLYLKSTHADQSELIQLLTDISTTSPKLSVKESDETAPFPQFKIIRSGKENGIRFNGIPNGHEFTSLVLAILNSDLKGKMPDEFLTKRIKNLKGPIQIQTFVSLTCENCPDVVQALNQMAILHGDFKHTMIDGAYTQDEINRLSIQGVPSIVVNDKLIHSGRITFLDLLTKLEETFGKKDSGTSVNTTINLGEFDVVVVGGGPAGASAAIYTIRKGLKTAIIADKIGGQVLETKGIENLVSVLYTEGPQLAAQLHKHVESYPIQLIEHRKVKSITKDDIKIITLDSGETLSAKAVIIATGAKWRELNVPGEKDYLGRGVAFCPHCDGPFYKGKKVSVIGGGNSGVEAAIDLAGIVKEVVLVEYSDELKADKILVDKLKSLPNTSIVTGAKTTKILGDGKKVNQLEYEDRKSNKLVHIDLDGVFIQIGLLPNSQFLKGIVELTSFGEVIVDSKGRTSVPGIYAAGDVTTTPFKQIVIAMGEGAKVALAAFEDRMYGKKHSV